MTRRRVVGWVLMVAAVTGLTASIFGVVLARRLLAAAEGSLAASLELVASTLDVVAGSLAVADDNLQMVVQMADRSQVTAATVHESLMDGRRLLTESARLTRTELAGSVEAIEEALPGVIDVATSVDGALAALDEAAVDVNYDPDQPFADSLLALQDSLAGMPADLRMQAFRLERGGRDLGRVGDDAAEVAEDFGELAAGLTRVDEALGRYTDAADEAGVLIEATRDDLARQAAEARLLVTVIGAVFALGQLAPLVLGWELAAGHRR